jgi:HSP20 family molecular chaperone IbpA
MRCRKCGNEVSEGWKFCPRCGSALREKKEMDVFGDIFERMEREMKTMDRTFERNFEVIDLSPFFAKPAKGSGFSIKITRQNDGKPNFSVKTFGDVDRKEVENEIGKLGFRDRISRALKPEKRASPEKPRFEEAKTTEEPETSVKNIAGKIVAEVKLPGVRNAEDIQISALENSVEIKALAGEKAYFKILTKPPNTSISRREFRNGVLNIEFS